MREDNGKERIKGIWLPGEVAFNKELSIIDRFIWWIIFSLDNSETHCYASNEYIANRLGLKSPQTISNSIARLKELGYIKEVSFNGRKRVIKIDNSYMERYEYLIIDYNRDYSLHIIKNIININKNISNISSSKEEEGKQACLSIIPKLINRKKLRIALQEMTNPITDRKVQKAIEYWNSKGKPFPHHTIQNSKIIKSINRKLRKKIKRDSLSLSKIVKTIDLYYELITSPLTTVKKVYNMSQFLMFDPYQVPRQKKETVNSWFDECLKGKDYLFKKYARYVKNNHPELTEKIWDIWKKKSLYVNNKDPAYMENNFRIAADKIVRFLGENSGWLVISRMDKNPLMFVNHIFNAAMSGGDVKKMRPGSISNDYFFSEILPAYLKQNGFMK